jgi:branched-subunit amino acid aminotransferase/4-amino-4-deoxychorismate lyase
VRVTVFPPELDLGHPGGRLEPHVLVSTRPAAKGELPPLRLQSTRYQREQPEVKHVGLFATIYHRRLAQAAGFDDVLFLDAAERVSEGATWNIGFVNGDEVIWPQASWLPGVTMRLVEGHAKERGTRCTARPVHRSDLDGMQAAFITNAALGLRPVSAIDDIAFAPASKLVKDLRDAYTAAAGEPI